MFGRPFQGSTVRFAKISPETSCLTTRRAPFAAVDPLQHAGLQQYEAAVVNAFANERILAAIVQLLCFSLRSPGLKATHTG